MGSVITFRLWVMYSTISLRAARFTSFHLRSLSGWETKSKRIQHWCKFWVKSFSWSAGGTSLNDGGFCSSLLLLVLNREKFCRLSFFTMGWGNGTFILEDVEDWTATRLFFLLEISDSMSCPSFELFPLFPGFGGSFSFLVLFCMPGAGCHRRHYLRLPGTESSTGSQRLRQPQQWQWWPNSQFLI